MIDHLNKQRNIDGNGFGVGYIYFEYQEQNQQTSLAVVTSLVKQLLLQIPRAEFPEDIRAKYEKNKSLRPSMDDLTGMLLSMPKNFKRVFVICDALDEMERYNQRDHLLPLFHRLKDSGIALFLTTRPHPADIQKSFRDESTIELAPQVRDIEAYVRRRLSVHQVLEQDPSLYGEAVRQIADSATGMYEKLPSFYETKLNNSHRFLLAKFNADYILEFPTAGGIRNALSNLSISEIATVDTSSERENERRMDEIYDRIIKSIHGKPQGVGKYAFRALSWIGYARRTLNVQELLVAISVDAGRYHMNSDEMYGLRDLLDICGGLVVADKDESVRLVHFSVRNYLDRHQVILKNLRGTYRAITCSTYLSFDRLKERYSTEGIGVLKKSLPFLDYAAHNLSFHLSEVEQSGYPETTSAILELLKDEGHRRAYCGANTEIGELPDIPRLNLACAIGYQGAVKTLLESADVDFNTKDTKHSLTPLSWAVRMRHEAVVRQLLEEDKVDRDCRDSNGRTPLSIAIANKNLAILGLLLERGVMVNFTYKEVSQPECNRTLGSNMYPWGWRQRSAGIHLASLLPDFGIAR